MRSAAAPCGPFGTPPKVGFIGLGIMGRPMVGHLLRAGYPMTVHTRTAATAAEALAAGATWAVSPADVAQCSDIVILMLPDTQDVRDVVTRPGLGLAGALRPRHVLVDMSTIDPVATRELARCVQDAGAAWLDAPVSGGEKGAREATLSIMVGGDADVFERVRPILENLGRTIVRVGDAGAGQVAKACNQLVVAATIQAVAEALTLASRAQVDPRGVREVMLGGFAASRVLEVHGQRMLSRTFEPGFRVRLHAKDARIITELAQAVGSAIPAFEVAAAALAELAETNPDLDHSALITLLEGAARPEAA